MVTKIIGISVPEEIVNEIDDKRGDVTRSKYISKLLEYCLEIKENKRKKLV